MLKSKQNQTFFLTCASPPMLLCSGHTKLIVLHVPYVFRALPLHILVQQLGMDFLPFSNGRTQLCLRTLWSLSWLPPSPQRDVVPSLCAQVCHSCSSLYLVISWSWFALPLDSELLEGGAVDCELFIFVSPAPRSINVEWNSCCFLIIHHIRGYFICTISNPPSSLLRLMFMLIFTGKETEAQKLSQ